MNKYSRNNKLNAVLTEIENQIKDFGVYEAKRYFDEFKGEIDYNIVQYGNLLVYFSDIYKLYRDCGYKTTDKFSTDKIWETYKRQVGYVVRKLMYELRNAK